MKKIKLEEAYKLLVNATALIIDNDVLVYPSLCGLTGEDKNEFLYLALYDEQGHNCWLKFNEADNLEVEVTGISMFLYDTNSEDERAHTQITILKSVELT
jgi:hypothetical protein